MIKCNCPYKGARSSKKKIYLYVYMLKFLLILGLFAMADFPPNLEDGEKWLPSDIYEEIISVDFKPKTNVGNMNKPIESKIINNKVVFCNFVKRKGTGAFIPKIRESQSVPKCQVRRGTGFYLPSIVEPADKTSVKEEKVYKGVPNMVENDTSKKESFSPSSS